MIRKLSAVVLLLFLVAGSATAFAFWDNLTDETDVTVTVGEGVTLSVTPDTFSDGNLVPEGVVLKDGDVESIEIEYTVSLDQDILNALDLNVTVSNKLINGSADNIGLVNIDVNPSTTTIQNSDVTVTVTVTLTEPSTQAEYDAIINGDITFDLTFEATQQ